MEPNITNIVRKNLNIDFIDMIISNAPNGSELTKVKVRPILMKEKLVFQASEYRGKQIFHSNYTKDELLTKLPDWLDNLMKQLQMRTQSKQVTILISKKGKATIKSKNNNITVDQATKNTNTSTDSTSIPHNNIMTHNREKTYVLAEGNPIPFLVDLGVMTAQGLIVKSKYDKYKQINRFLEFIEDILPSLDKNRELTIIDFGCGKSYLTFAMYYYLKELKGYQIKVIGLDLKKEVIKHCNELAQRYSYDKLNFLEGDIASYEGVDKVDMVVTLHACDTATDYALFKAVRWDADVILSVPCCQHELNAQIDCEILKPILRYGLIKERIAALATDALRAELLEAVGYKAQILEFIDMEHTPKNILIRAVKKTKRKERSMEERSSKEIPTEERPMEERQIDQFKTLSKDKLVSYDTCKEFLGVEPTLYRLLLEQYPLS